METIKFTVAFIFGALHATCPLRTKILATLLAPGVDNLAPRLFFTDGDLRALLFFRESSEVNILEL